MTRMVLLLCLDSAKPVMPRGEWRSIESAGEPRLAPTLLSLILEIVVKE